MFLILTLTDSADLTTAVVDFQQIVTTFNKHTSNRHLKVYLS